VDERDPTLIPHHAQDMSQTELFVSVDIETSGPTPQTGSMLSIGACLVDDTSVSFYVELKPMPDRPWSDDAFHIHRLQRDRLEREGLEPVDAMHRFSDWLAEVCDGRRPVFVGFNAAFDWMFVADHFWRLTGGNPFGATALDLKSYYMGRERIERWELTRRMHIDEHYGLEHDHNHNALDDARGQARIAALLMRDVSI
jgi:DNA polymerase III epsilon subunit-like protein